ncbi:LytTR family transcriptional regulator [Algoriphagus lacus]|uniref:LytTR family transcriptional regulator n=1 Tax=Algoriphagus lacus TaxID=2056311 RepID=A0A418PW90_9BACT|nr:LytTR family DNA-binding domain-containing protein [Algoriphagus lacus]RIW18391.1 LytTR family transcriptional regulator [Algoriphagus lacus]
MVKSSPFFKFRNAVIKPAFKFSVALVLIVLATIFQDYLHARYQSYSFFFSESLLFNLHWILILPVALLVRMAFRRSKILSSLGSKWASRVLFVLMATVVHLFFFAFLVFSVSGLFYDHTFGFWENVVYSVSNDLYKFLLIYAGVSLIPNPFTTISQNPTVLDRVDFLIFQIGKKTEKIQIDAILYIYSATPYVEFFTADKKYLQQGSLKSYSEKLDPSIFVRIHKSTLVNVRKVDSIHSRGNGDYDVLLSTGQQLRLSRNYVQDFRSKFEHAPSG